MIVKYFVKSIYSIKDNFFKEHCYKYVLIDLDNTLEPYNIKHPTLRVKDIGVFFKENGITPIIISNSIHTDRVKEYAACLGCDIYLFNSKKPFKFKVKKFLKDNNIDSNKCLMVGDQMMTDGKLAKKLKIDFLLTLRLSKDEQFFTKFNRIIEKPFRNKYDKMKCLDKYVGKI